MTERHCRSTIPEEEIEFVEIETEVEPDEDEIKLQEENSIWTRSPYYKEVKENDFKFRVYELVLSSLEKLEEQFLYITDLNARLKTTKSNFQISKNIPKILLKSL